MYAATDMGDNVWHTGDYLFCGDDFAHIDILGLNIERWVNDAGGRGEYNHVNQLTRAKQWPGAFLHSEEGGPIPAPMAKSARTWNQLPGFFDNWPNIDGFFGYAYYGNPFYNMFDGASSTSNELPDGRVFFQQVAKTGNGQEIPPAPVTRPRCDAIVNGHALGDYKIIRGYDTGPNGYAPNCPKPPHSVASVISV